MPKLLPVAKPNRKPIVYVSYLLTYRLPRQVHHLCGQIHHHEEFKLLSWYRYETTCCISQIYFLA